MIKKINDTFFLKQVPTQNVVWFRFIFCLMLIFQLLYDFEPSLYRMKYSPNFNPIPLFELFGLNRMSPQHFLYANTTLILCLLATLTPWLTRLSHFLALVFTFIVFGQLLSLDKAPDTNYVFHSRNVVAFFLLIFTFSPQKVLRPLWKPKNTSAQTSIWPLNICLFTLAISYFGASYCRFVEYGLLWLNGFTLQKYLLEHYLLLDISQALWLAQRYSLCLALSLALTFFETTFIFAIFNKKLRIPYALAGIVFHLCVYYFMHINFFKYHLLSYLIFIEWHWVEKLLRKFHRKTA